MIGEVPCILIDDQNFPARPKKQNQESKPTQSANGTRLRESLCVIVVTMIDDQAVVHGFVKRKNLLKGAQSGSNDGMIQENVPGSLQHLNASVLADFQLSVAGKALEGAPDPQPRYQDSSQSDDDGAC